MAAPPVKSIARQAGRLHPLPVRVMHWTNAVAIFIMIGSGWKIYDDDVIFGWLHFPDVVVIGKWAQHGLQWHFFGMWIFVINGLVYLGYGIATGRFRQKLFPLSLARNPGDGRRRAALSPRARRSDALQRRAEDSLSRHHGGRRAHRDLRARAVEAGAVLRAGCRCSAASRPSGSFISSAWRRSSAFCWSTWRSLCWCRKVSSPC